ncbi:MAG: hypothetical protein AAB174_00470, partial [Pseudomonadota bacterium]
LVVDDPADAAGIHEAAVHNRRDRLAVFDEREGVFALGFAVPQFVGWASPTISGNGSRTWWAVPTLLR